jgi:hypothetical protein
MRTSLRRTSIKASLAMLSLAVAASVGLAAPAEARTTARASAAADWMQAQLTNGLVHNDQYDFDDLGLSLDFDLALKDLRTKRSVRHQILDAVEPVAGSYVGTGQESYAAQLGKLLTAVQEEGLRPSDYGNGRLFNRLEDRVRRGGAQDGRAVDRSQYGNYTETIGQSFVVRAFALRGRALTGVTTKFLLRQQCNAGFFREKMGASRFSCQKGRSTGDSAPSVDATSFAVVALREARKAGVSGLGDDIADALRWLRNRQNANGSFSGNGAQNSNSTGLAAGVLSGSRYDGAARRAARWLTGLQLTAEDTADGTPDGGDAGAVAYNTAAFDQALTEDIGVADRDQWRRATAQAAVGLDALGAD